jgi:hypothetical protein
MSVCGTERRRKDNICFLGTVSVSFSPWNDHWGSYSARCMIARSKILQSHSQKAMFNSRSFSLCFLFSACDSCSRLFEPLSASCEKMVSRSAPPPTNTFKRCPESRRSSNVSSSHLLYSLLFYFFLGLFCPISSVVGSFLRSWE